jgi:hypothetical protein
MTLSLMPHLMTVEDVVTRMKPRLALAFGMACTERQWSTYERASRETSKDAVLPSVRRGLDEVWRWLQLQGPFPAGLSAEIRGLIPTDEEVDDPRFVLLHIIGNGMADFLKSVGENQPSYAHFTAARNVEVIEVLEDVLGNESEEYEQLLVAEMSRQNEDIAVLQGDLGNELIDRVKERAQGAQLLGEFWVD